jgi:hypothetical protein
MNSSYNMYLSHATPLIATHHLLDLIHRHIPRLGATRSTAERTELAVEDTQIGRLKMKIFVIKNLIATDGSLALNGQLTQSPQRSLTPQGKRILGRESLPSRNRGCYFFPLSHYFGAF